MPFVTERWLGGLLTNFVTVRKSLDRLKELELVSSDGRQERLTKKELAHLEKERAKLEKNLRGIKHMKAQPDAVFIVDTRREAIAVAEARKLRIPVIGVVDTNCDPDEVDVLIPGNDDALRAIRLFAGKIADAIIAGRSMREAKLAEVVGGAEASRAKGRATAAAAAASAAAEAAQVAEPAALPQAPETAGPAVTPAGSAERAPVTGMPGRDR